jgi:DnaJ family protein A protein 2
MADVRERAFAASADFFDRAQFGGDDDEDEDAWEDEEGEEPECRPQ